MLLGLLLSSTVGIMHIHSTPSARDGRNLFLASYSSYSSSSTACSKKNHQSAIPPSPPPTQCGRGTSAELDFGCRILGSFGVVLIGGGGVRIRIGPLHSDKVSAIIMVSIIFMMNVVDTHLMSTNDTRAVQMYTENVYTYV